MSATLFNVKRALGIFGSHLSPESVTNAAGRNLPAFTRSAKDRRLLKSWSADEIPAVGEKIGFLRRPISPMAVSVFVTKGGVLKTSLTLNLARMAALHNIRTCVVGLDMQGDISSAMGFNSEIEMSDDLDAALERMNSVRGLADVFAGDVGIEDVLLPTDLPTLFYVPETPELVALDQSLVNKNRREYWLKENVVEPLKDQFDLVIMDCSPNWNRLITNSLVACDVLISPLECKINNFRNFKVFQGLLKEFKADLKTDFQQVYVPTRLSPARTLSAEIYKWYRGHLAECLQTAIRESTQGEEATAMHLSLPEYAPTSTAAEEIRELLKEIWGKLPLIQVTEGLQASDSEVLEFHPAT